MGTASFQRRYRVGDCAVSCNFAAGSDRATCPAHDVADCSLGSLFSPQANFQRRSAGARVPSRAELRRVSEVEVFGSLAGIGLGRWGSTLLRTCLTSKQPYV